MIDRHFKRSRRIRKRISRRKSALAKFARVNRLISAPMTAVVKNLAAEIVSRLICTCTLDSSPSSAHILAATKPSANATICRSTKWSTKNSARSCALTDVESHSAPKATLMITCAATSMIGKTQSRTMNLYDTLIVHSSLDESALLAWESFN